MKQEALDTNVLVRFLVGDNEKQRMQAEICFQETEAGKRRIAVFPLVVAEAVFVLESFYKKSRVEIARSLLVFVSQRWLDVQDRDILLKLWPWYEQGFHFVDSFLLAWSQVNGAGLLTFDEDMKKKK